MSINELVLAAFKKDSAKMKYYNKGDFNVPFEKRTIKDSTTEECFSTFMGLYSNYLDN